MQPLEPYQIWMLIGLGIFIPFIAWGLVWLIRSSNISELRYMLRCAWATEAGFSNIKSEIRDRNFERIEFLTNKIEKMEKRKWLPGANSPGPFDDMDPV